MLPTMRARLVIYCLITALAIDVSAFNGRFLLTTIDVLHRGGDQIGAGTDYFVSKLFGRKWAISFPQEDTGCCLARTQKSPVIADQACASNAYAGWMGPRAANQDQLV